MARVTDDARRVMPAAGRAILVLALAATLLVGLHLPHVWIWPIDHSITRDGRRVVVRRLVTVPDTVAAWSHAIEAVDGERVCLDMGLAEYEARGSRGTAYALPCALPPGEYESIACWRPIVPITGLPAITAVCDHSLANIDAPIRRRAPSQEPRFDRPREQRVLHIEGPDR